MPTLETMTLEVRDRVARITFTRPESLNSLTAQALDDLENGRIKGRAVLGP